MDTAQNKIKVIWLCHFSNSELDDFFKKKRAPFAPWINELINLVAGDDRFDLYVVSPNYHTNKPVKFNIGGVNYVLYQHQPEILRVSILRKLFFYFNLEQRYYRKVIAKRIDEIAKDINPDIVHLHGVENPVYSWGGIALMNKLPILTTIQGFIGRAATVNSKIKLRIRLEKQLIRNLQDFGVRTLEMESDILKENSSARLYWHNYPINIPEITNVKNKSIDCVFFARVIKDKGIEDLIKAIHLVKKNNPSISLSIVGPVNHTYKQHLLAIIEDLNLKNNISFTGFFEKQSDMYSYVSHAKMCVLPTYHDIIPGTIIESMYMKLPVIAYAVGGIPEINRDRINIGLVERNDISGLANKISELLNKKDLRDRFAIGAYEYASKRFVNEEIPNDLYSIYSKVIRNYSYEKTN